VSENQLPPADASFDEPSDEGGPEGDAARGERLQKVLAAAGLGSRRQCEELILAGRVEVDRQVVLELGSRVDPRRQAIRVDGQPLARPRRVHYLVHKPAGVVSTNSDPAGRPRVIDLMPTSDRRLFTIGRLDLASEGLILLTNDGELANLLTHPRYGVEKTYHIRVAGTVDHEELMRLKKGVFLAEGFARVVRFTVLGRRGQSTLVEIVLNEGRNREIRRLLARVGHKVLSLKRVAIGGVRLGDLAPGESRPLRPDELRTLKESVHMARRGRFRRGVVPARGGPRGPRPARPDAETGGGPPFPVETRQRRQRSRPPGGRAGGGRFAKRPGSAGPGKPHLGGTSPGKPSGEGSHARAAGAVRPPRPGKKPRKPKPLGSALRKKRGPPRP
jgi:23S rRNA pseudouridine2605 synthase